MRRTLLSLLTWMAVTTLATTATQATTRDVCPSGCTYATIQAAVNAAISGDLIDIGPGVYTELVLVDVPNLTFAGAGAGDTVVEGPADSAFVFYANAMTATLSGVTLRSLLLSPIDGGCIRNYAMLTVRDSVLETCQTQGVGGGIYTRGDLVLEHVTMRTNTSVPLPLPMSANSGRGGGLYVDGDTIFGGPTVRVLNSELTGNTALFGGGIYIGAGARVFIDSTLLDGNTAGDSTGAFLYTGRGGGIRTFGELHLTNSTLIGNSADLHGGGMAVNCTDADVRIANTLVTGNYTEGATFDAGALPSGGGLYVESGGMVKVVGSEFNGNVSGYGGGIGVYNLLLQGSVTVTQSGLLANIAVGNGGGLWIFGGDVTLNTTTVASNYAEGWGGGIDGGNVGNSVLALKSATIFGNFAEGTGGGLANVFDATLRNTILAGNTALTPTLSGDSAHDCESGATSEDYNLIGTLDGCTMISLANDLTGTDVARLDPVLGPLTDIAALTTHFPPLAGSPAVDSGGECQVVDQRGYLRPADGGTGVSQCDRGAVELNAPCGAPMPTTALDPTEAAVDVVLRPLLVWEPKAGAVSYDVKLATQPPPFAGGIVAEVAGLTATHWQPEVTLLVNNMYYWQVRAHSPCGSSVRSDVFSFTTTALSN
jgi:hypothetical protein